MTDADDDLLDEHLPPTARLVALETYVRLWERARYWRERAEDAESEGTCACKVCGERCEAGEIAHSKACAAVLPEGGGRGACECDRGARHWRERAEAAERTAHRLVHGEEIESDRICEHELAAVNERAVARRESDDLRRRLCRCKTAFDRVCEALGLAETESADALVRAIEVLRTGRGQTRDMAEDAARIWTERVAGLERRLAESDAKIADLIEIADRARAEKRDALASARRAQEQAARDLGTTPEGLEAVRGVLAMAAVGTRSELEERVRAWYEAGRPLAVELSVAEVSRD